MRSVSYPPDQAPVEYFPHRWHEKKEDRTSAPTVLSRRVSPMGSLLQQQTHTCIYIHIYMDTYPTPIQTHCEEGRWRQGEIWFVSGYRGALYSYQVFRALDEADTVSTLSTLPDS